MSERASLHPTLDRIQTPALIAGAAGLLLCAIGFLVARPQFYLAWLYAYLFWIGLALGSMALLMLQHLSGGGWGLVIRRLLESATRMLPVMALLFVPILLGLFTQDRLYVWTLEDKREHLHLGHEGFRGTWLSTGFFLARTAFYFLVWLGFAFVLNRWSVDQDVRPYDRTESPRGIRRIQRVSGGGLLIYGLTTTFAAFDWVMSLDPLWYSTIWGVIFMIGQALSTIALMIALLALLSQVKPLSDFVGITHFHDLGNLLLAFTMLWAYVSFSQYLIIWSGNIAEETPFYVYRTNGAWKYVALALIVLHFFVPFLLLLSRRTKRTVRYLTFVALGILVMRFVDLYWVVKPMYYQGHGHETHFANLATMPALPHWLDIAAPIGIGGVWVWLFINQLRRLPLIPPHDPRVVERPKEVHHHG
jgi:hypothetical protein